ncbi:MAG: EAL domain-containing protein, partial [Burkholderiales bacterium]|nr:EAL domain-containing protein [Burkholderiales bacterium]
IAEGVETPNQLDCARSIGIHWAQGYLWGRAQGLPESESH